MKKTLIIGFIFSCLIIKSNTALAAQYEPIEIDKIIDDLNPLKMLSYLPSNEIDSLSTPRGFLSRLLTFIFPLAGLLLFLMLVWGGFEIFAAPLNKGNADAGRNRITAALIGYLILFCSYWLAQIIEAVFNVSILG